MTLLLLAAGFATRLGDKFSGKPKHLLPAGERLMIDWVLQFLSPADKYFSKKVLIANEVSYPMFLDWRKNSGNLDIEILRNGVRKKEERLGAVGDFLLALKLGKIEDDILVCAADYALKDFDFVGWIKEFKKKKTSMIIAAPEEEVEVLRAGSCIEFDKSGQVTAFEEKPKKPFSKFYGAPYYLIKKEDTKIIKKIPRDLRDNMGQIVEKLLSDSQVFCQIHKGKILHLTSEKDLEELNKRRAAVPS